MTIRQACDIFVNFLVNELEGKLQNNNWISIRGERLCSECRNHSRSALYIFVTESSPVFLNCFRAGCDTKRTITLEDFKAMGFKNDEAIKILLSNTNTKKITYKKSSNMELIITDTELSMEQENYIYDRCGFVPTSRDIELFRIIPDLRSVIYENFTVDSSTTSCPNASRERIQLSKEDIDFTKSFKHLFNKDTNMKGFITYFTNDSNKFIYRNISNKITLKGQLKRSNATNSIYYVRRGAITRNIVITEGFFDLLNIYKYFCVGDDMLYSCTGGFSAFENHIVTLYKENISTVENLILFCDSDKTDTISGKPTIDIEAITRLFKRVFNKIPRLAFKNIYLCHNSSSKDFGDLREKITPVKYSVDVSCIDYNRGGKIKLTKMLH